MTLFINESPFQSQDIQMTSQKTRKAFYSPFTDIYSSNPETDQHHPLKFYIFREGNCLVSFSCLSGKKMSRKLSATADQRSALFSIQCES